MRKDFNNLDEYKEEPIEQAESEVDFLVDDYEDLEIERIKSSRDSSLTWGRLE